MKTAARGRGSTHADQQGGDGRTVLIVDHGQQARQVTLSGPGETQPVDRNSHRTVSGHTGAETTA